MTKTTELWALFLFVTIVEYCAIGIFFGETFVKKRDSSLYMQWSV